MNLGQKLVASLDEAISHEKGQTMLREVVVKKPEEKKPTNQRGGTRAPLRRPAQPSRVLVSKRTKNLAKVRVPRLSPKQFVEGWRQGPVSAGEFAADLANKLKISIAENDSTNMSLEQQKRNLGFWTAAAAYGKRFAKKG